MASRAQNKLTDLAVRKAKAPGWYGDGGGLYLRISADAKRWVFVFQWQDPGQAKATRRELGLGALAEVSLKAARDARDEAKRQMRAGLNPIEERRRLKEEAAQPAPEILTFGQWAEQAAPAIGPRAAKARKAWVSMMQEKVGALAQLAPAEVTTEHVLAALKPYWLTRPESGRRMRQRIERVLDAAKAKGLIEDPWNNPARLRGHLENLLPKRPTAVKHHVALPYSRAPGFMAELRLLDRVPALALRFTVLTLARTGETRGATWSEIDRAGALWTVPSDRMKGPVELRREHRVPLCDEALEVLDAVWKFRAETKEGVVFPSIYKPRSRSGRLSENAMERVLHDMGLKGAATVHGMRSTFKDWAEDTTNFPNGLIEAALAHLVGDETERAYRRSDALLKRRKLMEAWAGYLARPAAGNVHQLGRVRG